MDRTRRLADKITEYYNAVMKDCVKTGKWPFERPDDDDNYTRTIVGWNPDVD
jgi:hypothetical protein